MTTPAAGAGTRRRRALRRAAWAVVLACLGAYAVVLAVPLWFQVQDQRLLVVTSDSMAPHFRAGDAVVVQAVTDASELRVGQVISFWPTGGERLVTHTIVDLPMIQDMAPDPGTGVMEPVVREDGTPVTRAYVVTKGAANQENDPDATPVSRVRGVVLGVHEGWGVGIGWAHSPTGRWVMLAPPLVLLALLELTAAPGALRPRRRRGRPDGESYGLLLD